MDENLDRGVADGLEGEGYRADRVVDVLDPGTDDDELAYAIENDVIVVTRDASDFGILEYGDHEGILLVRNHEYSAFRMATAILSLVDAYDDRDDLRHREILDKWVDQ